MLNLDRGVPSSLFGMTVLHERSARHDVALLTAGKGEESTGLIRLSWSTLYSPFHSTKSFTPVAPLSASFRVDSF